MRWFTDGRLHILAGLLPFALVLVACSGASGTSDTVLAPPEGRATATEDTSSEIAPPTVQNDGGLAFALNVYATDESYRPSAIFVPFGRRVRLVFRNVGKTEHHYRIIGMEAAEMLWMVGPDDMQTPEGVTLEERELHHLSGWAPFKLESPAGIKPFGDEVHAYAPAHDKDVLLFTPTQKGTFEVECPLHAEAVGKIVVF